MRNDTFRNYATVHFRYETQRNSVSDSTAWRRKRRFLAILPQVYHPLPPQIFRTPYKILDPAYSDSNNKQKKRNVSEIVVSVIKHYTVDCSVWTPNPYIHNLHK